MAAGEVIYAKNVGDTIVRWKYANQPYIIKPGQMAIVPWECMCLWMGNPEAMDLDERRRNRRDELTRLQFKFGCYTDPVLWEELKPKVECYTLSDERITTVVDDPYGESIHPDVTTKAQNQLMAERMAKLEAELKSLRRTALVQDNQDSAESAATAVDEDARPGSIVEQIQVFEGEPPKPDKPDLPRAVTEDAPTRVPSEIGSE